MGTMLTVMIGLLAPTADPSSTSSFKVNGNSQVTIVVSTTPAAPQRQTAARQRRPATPQRWVVTPQRRVAARQLPPTAHQRQPATPQRRVVAAQRPIASYQPRAAALRHQPSARYARRDIPLVLRYAPEDIPLPLHYAQEDIALPPQPGTFDGGDFSAGPIVDEPYFEPSYACKLGVCSCQGRLPCPWRARCNLPQHHPYEAGPKTYYYFRAYTHIHLPAIQEEAVLHGASRSNPYDTKLFAGVYDEMARQLKEEAEAAAEAAAAAAGVEIEIPSDDQ